MNIRDFALKRNTKKLSTLPPRTMVLARENGKLRPFYVVQHKYNGFLHRTLLLRVEPLPYPISFSTSEDIAYCTSQNGISIAANDYQFSHIADYLECDYSEYMDIDACVILNSLSVTAFRYDDENAETTDQTDLMPSKYFPLSARELFPDQHSFTNAAEGVFLPFFSGDNNRVAKIDKKPVKWVLRTPVPNTTDEVFCIDENGEMAIASAFDELYVRPAFCVNSQSVLHPRRTKCGSIVWVLE